MDQVYQELVTRGACRNADPTLFDYDNTISVQRKVIKMFCQDCPVRYLCRDFAIDHQFVGVWGFSTSARNRLAKYVGRPVAL